jgi:hypothetical protein
VRAAACSSVAVADCLSWRSVSNTSFKVNPPVIPLVPRVKVRGPRYVHVCDTPVFDLDLSLEVVDIPGHHSQSPSLLRPNQQKRKQQRQWRHQRVIQISIF